MASSQLVSEIDRLINAQNFHLAYQKWIDLKTQEEAGEFVEVDTLELRQSIEDGARKLRNAAIARLDELTVQEQIETHQFDAGSCEIELERLRRATLRDESELNGYRQRVTDTIVYYQQRGKYDLVRKQVQDQWAAADRELQNNSNVSPQVLMSYYTRAWEIAQEQFGQDRENRLLERLVEATEARRTRASTEEKAMTSASQIKEYGLGLQFIHSAHDDDLITTYNPDGTFKARLPKADALRELENRARADVRNNVASYIDSANRLLDTGNPHAAQAELKRYDQYRNLETLVDNLLGDLGPSLSQVIDRARVEMIQLEDAEAAAKRAAEKVDTDPLAAWNSFVQARDSYKGAKNSRAVIEQGEAIQNAIFVFLRTEVDVLESDIQEGKFGEVAAYASQLTENYGGVGDLSKSAIINRLTTLQQRGKTLEDQRRTLLNELNGLNPQTDPNAADRRLKALQTSYDALLFQVEPIRSVYERISNRIDARINQAAAIERLSQYKQSRNLDEVISAIDQAENLASEHGIQEFRDVAFHLGIQKKVLEAEQLARRNLPDAIETLKVLEERIDIPNDQHRQIAKRRSELEERYGKMQRNDNNLRRAEDALADSRAKFTQRIDLALAALAQVAEFENDTQKQRWQAAFETLLHQLPLDVEFNLTQAKRCLEIAENHFISLSNSYHEWFYQPLEAQKARQEDSSGRKAEALQIWRNLETLTGGSDHQYVLGETSRIQRDVYDDRRKQVSRKPTDLDSTTYNRDNWLSQIEALTNELRDNYDPADTNTAEYTLWIVQLTRLRAENSLHEVDIAISLLKSLSEDLPQLERECIAVNGTSLREKNFLREAERNLKAIRQADAFARALEGVARYLTLASDIDDFALARETWTQIVDPLNAASGQLLSGFVDWYLQQVSTLIEKLKEAIRLEGGDLNAVTLPWMAKLLILDPRQESALIRELAKVSDEIDEAYAKFLGGLRTGQNYPPGKDSVETVDKQIELLRKQREYLRVIARVAERFTRGIGELTAEQSLDLARNANQKVSFYKAMVDGMELFRSASNHVDTYIQNLTLNYYNRTTFEADMKAKWNEYQTAAAQADKDITEKTATDNYSAFNSSWSRGFNEHPRMVTLHAAREAKLSQLRALQNDLVELEGFAEREMFQSAYNLYQRLNTSQRQTLERSPSLYERFGVRDVFENELVVGWEKLNDWLALKLAQRNAMKGWGDKVGIPDLTSAEPETEEIETVAASAGDSSVAAHSKGTTKELALKKVVSWQAYKDVASKQVRQGDYDDAETTIRLALEGGALLETSQVEGLTDTYNYLMEPLIADKKALTTSYDAAIRGAGSLLSQHELIWLRDTALPQLERDIRDAQTALEWVAETRIQWQRAVTMLTGLVAQASPLADKNRLRGNDCKELKSLVVQIDNVLTQMAALSNEHAHIQTFRNSPALRYTRQRASECR